MPSTRARELHLAARRFRFDPLGFAKMAVPFGRPGTPFHRFKGFWVWQSDFLRGVGTEAYKKRFGVNADGDVERKEPILRSLSSGTDTGKCNAHDTMVLTADGRTVRADSVRVGDRLLGPSGAARTVVSLARGRGEFYQITPNKGEPWKCTEDHVLTLIGTGDRVGGQVVDVTVREWLTWSKKRKHCFKLFRSGPVEFPDAPRHPLPVDPWLLGVLIGDGALSHGTPIVTTKDPEIVAGLHEKASGMGLRVSVSPADESHSCASYRLSGPVGGWRKNPLLAAIRSMGLTVNSGEKFIPDPYRTASVSDRLEILAGLMDTDGSCDPRGVFDYISKSKRLAHDVVFVARSVGLRATIRPKVSTGFGVTGTYWRVTITGKTGTIPCRIKRKQRTGRPNRDALRTGFRVEPIGEADYYGWTLREDPHFLLGDFTVTHNSSLILPIMIFWTLACYPGSRGLCVSPTAAHIGDKLFANVKALLDASPFLQRYFEANADGMLWVRGAKTSRACIFRTSATKEGLSGYHAYGGVMIVVFDDAAGVDEDSFAGTDGARNDPQVICIAAGQPTRLEGWFHRVTHGPLGDSWNVLVLSMLDVIPGIDDAFRRRKILEYEGGEESADYRNQVLGLPALSDSLAFITRKRCEESMSRELFSPDGVPLVPFNTPLVAGLDPAREGENNNCMAFTAGIDGSTVRPVSVKGADLGFEERAQWAIQQATKERPPYGAPVVCFYDCTGLDGGFEMELNRLGYGHLFIPVDFRHADPSDRYENMRGALWSGFRQWIKAGGVLPNDPALATLISSAKATMKPGRRKMLITPKEELGKIAGHSHLDELDARMLSTLAPPSSAVDPSLLEVRLPHDERTERVSWAS